MATTLTTTGATAETVRKPRLELVAADPAYAEDWLRWRRQTNAQCFNPFEESSLEVLRQRLNAGSGGIIAGLEDAQWIALDLVAPLSTEDAPRAIGLFGVRLNWRMKTASIGYHLDSDVQGRGLGLELVQLGLQRVWARDEIRKVTATIHCENIASKKIVERLGFTYEGCRRKEWLLDDVEVDVDSYSLLREEVRP